MPTKLTDDIRILLALKAGYTVRNYYKAGSKNYAPNFWSAIQDPGEKDEKRHRTVSLSSLWRCQTAGLIVEIHGARDPFCYDHDITHALTEAGRVAADAIEDISIETALTPPKERKPKPERTYEERKLDKKKGYVKGTLRHLVKENMRVVRTPPNARGGWSWQWYPMDLAWVKNQRYADCRDVYVLMPLLEEFVSPVDCMTSLRPNAEGLEIIAKRRPLPESLNIKA